MTERSPEDILQAVRDALEDVRLTASYLHGVDLAVRYGALLAHEKILAALEGRPARPSDPSERFSAPLQPGELERARVDSVQIATGQQITITGNRWKP